MQGGRQQICKYTAIQVEIKGTRKKCSRIRAVADKWEKMLLETACQGWTLYGRDRSTETRMKRGVNLAEGRPGRILCDIPSTLVPLVTEAPFSIVMPF